MRMPAVRFRLLAPFQRVGDSVSVPPFTSSRLPAFEVKLAALMFVVPSVALTTPVVSLVKFVGLIVKVCPAVSLMRVPALMMLPAQ